MKKILGLIGILLVVLLCSIALADSKVKEGIEYWPTADSKLAPEQIVDWMASQPMRFLTAGPARGFDGDMVMFGVFDVKAPNSNEQNIIFVRILIYRYEDESKPMTLAGYTIIYSDKEKESYKYKVDKGKYMVFDYSTGQFQDENDNDRLPDEIPTIPKRGAIEI